MTLKVDHSDLEISRFLKVARSFIYKVLKELETEAGNVSPISNPLSSLKHLNFIQQVQPTIDDNPRKSRSLAKDFHVAERTVRNVVREDIIYKFYEMRKDQFISENQKKIA